MIFLIINWKTLYKFDYVANILIKLKGLRWGNTDTSLTLNETAYGFNEIHSKIVYSYESFTDYYNVQGENLSYWEENPT